MALDFVAGCVGGCAGVIVGHPLDTVKVRLQTQDYKNPIYRGTWHCFTSIARNESISGLYRGVTSPLGGVAIVNAIVFGVYGFAQRTLGHETISQAFLAGAAAGLSQAFICSPLELAKTRLQVSDKYHGTWDCIRKVFKAQGTRGVFKGLGLTMMREAPSYGTYFATYEYLTGGQNVTTWQILLAGGLAGSASWLIVYPVDVIKTRMQSDGVQGAPKYRNAVHCLKESLKAEGPRFLTRGLVSTIVRAFPTNAATFTVVNWIIRLTDAVTIPVVVRKDKEVKFSFKASLNKSVHLFEEGSLAM